MALNLKFLLVCGGFVTLAFPSRHRFTISWFFIRYKNADDSSATQPTSCAILILLRGRSAAYVAQDFIEEMPGEPEHESYKRRTFRKAEAGTRSPVKGGNQPILDFCLELTGI